MKKYTTDWTEDEFPHTDFINGKYIDSSIRFTCVTNDDMKNYKLKKSWKSDNILILITKANSTIKADMF